MPVDVVASAPMAEPDTKIISTTDISPDLELVPMGDSAKSSGERDGEKVDNEPYRLTWKHAAALFSLTLLWLSAAGPVFFITASIGNSSMPNGISRV
jgi:hypothetical protein